MMIEIYKSLEDFYTPKNRKMILETNELILSIEQNDHDVDIKSWFFKSKLSMIWNLSNMRLCQISRKIFIHLGQISRYTILYRKLKKIFSESLGITLLNHYRKTEQRTRTDKDWSFKVLALKITKLVWDWKDFCFPASTRENQSSSALSFSSLTSKSSQSYNYSIWNWRLNYWSIANISIQVGPFVDYARMLETRQF